MRVSELGATPRVRASCRALGGAALGALLLSSAACASYTSDYRPPNDGRARVVWDDVDALAVLPPAEITCAVAVDESANAPVSVHRGAGAVVIGPHFVFIGPPPPIGHVHLGAHHHVGAHHSGAHHTGAFSGGGSSGGKNSPPEALVALAVVAIIAMPGITIGLAAGRPEPEDEVALAIDRVNAYNDLARYPGTVCSSPSQVAP